MLNDLHVNFVPVQKITEEEGLTEWVHPERKKEATKKKKTTKSDGKKKKGQEIPGFMLTPNHAFQNIMFQMRKKW